MAGVCPGLIWRPIDYSGHRPTDELTAHTLHEAVTRAEQSVFGWVSSEGSCNWFNGKGGYAEQYIPAGIQSYANSDGNHRSFAMESYDGLKIVNDPSYREVGIGGIYGDSAQTGRWDAGQCERAADVTAWLHLEYGLPLRVMLSSHTSEHGVGPHRLGVPGWPGGYDDVGGERWTKHPDKPCPGDLRIAQIPGIVVRAQVIADAIQAGVCSYLPQGLVDVPAALARTGKTSTPSGTTGPTRPTTPPPAPPTPKDWFDMATQADLTAAVTAALSDPKVLRGVADAVLGSDFPTSERNEDGTPYVSDLRTIVGDLLKVTKKIEKSR